MNTDKWATSSLLTSPWYTYPLDFSTNPHSRHSLLLTTIPINNRYTSENVISSSWLTGTLNPKELLQQKLPPYFNYFTSPIAQFPFSHSEVNKKLITKARSSSSPRRSELQNKINNASNNMNDFKSDVDLLKAVQQVNSEFVIEEISPAGQQVLTTTTSERAPKPIKLLVTPTPSPHLGEAFPKFSETKIGRNELKVEATGKTATSGPTPQIPFSTYFLPYLSKDRNYGSKTSALILEPHSKAIVGNGGTAVSTPISRAFLKRGVPTNVYFNPESVAIAGVGGKAHAQADLELDLVDSRSHTKIPSIFAENVFPYYGGLRGQILHLVRTKDGMDNMFILSSADNKDKPLTKTSGITISTEDIQPHKITSTTAFEKDFNRIQIAAARLVAIQEIAKRKGSFSAEDNRIYGESLLELGQAAQNLANLQKTGQIKDFSQLLQSDFQMPHKQPLFPSESLAETENLTGEQKVDEVTEQQFNEEDFLPPNTEDPYEDVSDTVAVTAPKKDASVAEAKPIGLSIAGEGGVASSKPNAIALSGRNGLAVSAPKATAIAGVSAEEAAAFSVSVPNRNNLVIKTVHSQAQGPLYDDYNEDYSEVVPVRSTFSRVAMNTRKSPPSDVNKKSKYVSGTEGELSGSLINKWRTMVAEDYSASTRHL